MNQEMKIMKIGTQFLLSKHASPKMMAVLEEKEEAYELVCYKQIDYRVSDLEECMNLLIHQFDDLKKDLAIFLHPSFSVHEKKTMKSMGMRLENGYFVKQSNQSEKIK